MPDLDARTTKVAICNIGIKVEGFWRTCPLPAGHESPCDLSGLVGFAEFGPWVKRHLGENRWEVYRTLGAPSEEGTQRIEVLGIINGALYASAVAKSFNTSQGGH